MNQKTSKVEKEFYLRCSYLTLSVLFDKEPRMASLFFRFWEVKTKLFTCKPPINPIKWCKEKIFHSIPSFKKA